MDEQKAKPRTNLDGLSVRNLTQDEGRAYVQTHEKNSGGPFGGVEGLPFFNWQYLGVPENHLWVKVAVPDAEEERRKEPFAAVYAIVPRRFVIDSQECMGAVSLHTLTGPAYRGRGLFVHLATDCYASAIDEGLKLVYGFPNENSVHGFTKYLDWRIVKRGEYLISIRPLAWLRGRLFGEDRRSDDIEVSLRNGDKIRIRRLEAFDDRFDALWERCSPLLKISAVRDRAFLQWRFAEHPQVDYGIYAAESMEGDLLAYCVTRSETKSRGTRGYIMDMMGLPDQRHATAALVRHAARVLARQGANLTIVNMGTGAPWYEVLRRAGFFPVPERFVPMQQISYRGFDSSLRTLHERPEHWHITYADIDVL